MNGCCPTHADSIYHGEECYWYWPCGCPKKRSNESKLKPHKHVFQGIDGGDGQEEAREDPPLPPEAAGAVRKSPVALPGQGELPANLERDLRLLLPSDWLDWTPDRGPQ